MSRVRSKKFADFNLIYILSLFIPYQESFRQATSIIFKSFPINSLTLDNDKSYANYELIERDINIQIYFAHPYHYWERSLNENFNGLIREYFPKKQKYAKLDISEINRKLVDIENLLNNRPRKMLNYLTPLESYQLDECCSED